MPCGCKISELTAGTICINETPQKFGVPIARWICRTIATGVSAMVAIVSGAISFLYDSVFGSKIEAPTLEYHAVTDSNNLETTYVGGKCYKGTEQDEHIVLQGDREHHVFGRGGLDLFTASDEALDVFYFSMCSTKIIDGKVATIYDFNPKQDKIELFCTMKPVEESDVKVYTSPSENMTFVEIAGKFDTTAIAVEGLYPDLKDSGVISYNQRYDVVAGKICNTVDSEFTNA